MAEPGAAYDSELSRYLAETAQATNEALAETAEGTAVDDATANLFLDAEFGLRPALDDIFRTKSFRKMGVWLADQVRQDAMDENGLIGSRLRAAGEWGTAKGVEVLRRYGYEPGGEPGPWMNLFRRSGILPDDFTAADLAEMATPAGRQSVLARLRANAHERARERVLNDPDVARWRAQLDEKRQQALGVRDAALTEVEARRQQAVGMRDRTLGEVEARRQQAVGMRDAALGEVEARRQQVATSASGMRDAAESEYGARQRQVAQMRDQARGEVAVRQQQLSDMRGEVESRRQQLAQGVEARRQQAMDAVEGMRSERQQASEQMARFRAAAEERASWGDVAAAVPIAPSAEDMWRTEISRRGRAGVAARTIEGFRTQSTAAAGALAEAATTAADEADEFGTLQRPRSLSQRFGRTPSILEQEGDMTGNFFTRAAARLKSIFATSAASGAATSKAFTGLQALSSTAGEAETAATRSAAEGGARDVPWLDTLRGHPGPEYGRQSAAAAVHAGTDVLEGTGEEITARAKALTVLGTADADRVGMGEAISRFGAHMAVSTGLMMGLGVAEDQIQDEQTRRGVTIATNVAQTADQIVPARFGGGVVESATDRALDGVLAGVRDPTTLNRPPAATAAEVPTQAGVPVGAERPYDPIALRASEPAADAAATTAADASIVSQGATVETAAEGAADAAAGLEGVAEEGEAADEVPGVGEVLGALFGIGMLIGSIAETDKPAEHMPDFTGIPLPAWQPGT